MKILAVSSIGGHWVQLLRLMPAFEGTEVEFVTTKESFSSMVEGKVFYSIPDANRWDKYGLVKCFFRLFEIVRKSKPNCIITTGAAPGLIAIFIGKLLFIKTIWIDSIANCEEMSMSGKIATIVADVVYTQWEHLANKKIKFCGNVLK